MVRSLYLWFGEVRCDFGFKTSYSNNLEQALIEDLAQYSSSGQSALENEYINPIFLCQKCIQSA